MSLKNWKEYGNYERITNEHDTVEQLYFPPMPKVHPISGEIREELQDIEVFHLVSEEVHGLSQDFWCRRAKAFDAARLFLIEMYWGLGLDITVEFTSEEIPDNGDFHEEVIVSLTAFTPGDQSNTWKMTFDYYSGRLPDSPPGH